TTTTEAAGETTTTEAAGETTTTEAAGETTTTAAGETTTTAAGATTTTTAPGGVAPPPATDTPPTVSPQPDPPFPSDPPGGSEALPPIHEVVVDPGGNEVDLGTLDSEESAQLESQLDTGITNDGDSDDTVPGATGAATGKPFGAEEIAGSILAAGGAAGLVVLLRRRNKPEIQSD
ncbi:MAG: hypothetical protein FWC87_15515, partial [Acidimicrobiaceae bacterium]|nr:hypothetical protein [Acidimicrobiaceae bacterium]